MDVFQFNHQKFKKKLILQEDDCAPDAGVYFDEKFKELVGFSIRKFMRLAKEFSTRSIGTVYDTKGYSAWIVDNYMLEISADDPYYKLYKLETKKP